MEEPEGFKSPDVQKLLNASLKHLDDQSTQYLETQLTWEVPYVQVWKIDKDYLVQVPLMWDESVYPSALDALLNKGFKEGCEYVFINWGGNILKGISTY